MQSIDGMGVAIVNMAVVKTVFVIIAVCRIQLLISANSSGVIHSNRHKTKADKNYNKLSHLSSWGNDKNQEKQQNQLKKREQKFVDVSPKT